MSQKDVFLHSLTLLMWKGITAIYISVIVSHSQTEDCVERIFLKAKMTFQRYLTQTAT